MATAWTPHNRAIKQFLQQSYDAKSVRIISGGKHERLEFYINGNREEILTHAHRDGRNIANDISKLMRRFGPPKPNDPKPKTTLDQLVEQATVEAPKPQSTLASRALAPIGQHHSHQQESKDSSGIRLEVSTHVLVHKDDDGTYDLLFRTPTRAMNGTRVVRGLRTVAGLVLELPVIEALYERIRDVVDPIREREEKDAQELRAFRKAEAERLAEEEEAARLLAEIEAQRKPRKKWNYDNVPLGIEANLKAARIILEGRELASEAAGGKRGGTYFRYLHDWYESHGLGNMPVHTRHDINLIADSYVEIEKWCRRQSAAKYADKKAGRLVLRFQEWQKQHPPEPKIIVPEPNSSEGQRETEQQAVTEPMRGHDGNGLDHHP